MAAYLALRSHGERQKIRQNHLDKSEAELIYEYRLSRAAILELCDILKEDLQSFIRSPKALTVVEKVLISLKLLASGSFLSSTKDIQRSVRFCQDLFTACSGKKKDFIYRPMLTVRFNDRK